jgi:hypothetical protein
MKTILNILLLLPFMVNGQSEVYREYYEKNGFCSFSMKLFADSTYFYETGCEGRSNVNFGKWEILSDTIHLTPIDTVNFNKSISITYDRPKEKDSNLVIRVIDMYNRPIGDFDLIVVPKEIDSKWINMPGRFTLKQEGETDIFLESIKTDDNGYVSVNCNPKSVIKLIDVLQMFNINEIDYSEFNGENITIKLNVMKEMFRYPELKWLQLPNNKLVNNLKELEFVKTMPNKK